MVKMEDSEIIGTSEWISIRAHGNRNYLPLKGDLIAAYALKRGDRLLIKIEKVQRQKIQGGK